MRYIKKSDVETIKKERTIQYEKAKGEIWHENLDALSCRRMRKQALKEWTEKDEEEYLTQINKCKQLITELPPIIPDDVEIISDKEYEKLKKSKEVVK